MEEKTEMAKIGKTLFINGREPFHPEGVGKREGYIGVNIISPLCNLLNLVAYLSPRGNDLYYIALMLI